MEELKQKIRDIPDFPKPGIVFKDITTLLQDRVAFRTMVDRFNEVYANHDVDLVAGIEARGFLFAPSLAYHLDAGVIPLRKPSKLPGETMRIEYDLEYGTDSIEMHKDAINGGDRVLIVDDLLATGGTARAVGKLVNKLRGKIFSYCFLIYLKPL